MQKVILKLGGMSCSACSSHIEKYLNKQKGVIDASVNLVMSQALITYEDYITIPQLEEYIKDSGYQSLGIYDAKVENKKDNNKIYLNFLGLLLIFLMYISMSHMLGLPTISFLHMKDYPINYSLCLLLLTIPYLIYGRDILIKGIKNLFSKNPNMDTLVALGVLVSFIYSIINTILILLGKTEFVEQLYFESVATIILFVKLGRYIDSISKDKTKEAIQELVTITPESALLKTKDSEKEVTIDEVKVGDTLIVKPGMKVAVDGIITKGTSHFDEAFITGESKPVKKSVGDKVIAGAINYDGNIEYKAEKIGPKSTISEIVHLVVEATNSKASLSKIADKISLYFVPIIIVIALITFVTYLILGNTLASAITHLVTVLVVACPCSLGLATPLAIVVSVGTSFKNGILVKSGSTLENINKVSTIVFDKTGTLTYGNLNLFKTFNYSNYKEKELLNLVAALEKETNHPISNAFVQYNIKNYKVTEFKNISGFGITGKINNNLYNLGNKKYVDKLEIINKYETDEEYLLNNGCSIIYVMENNKIIALIGIKDILRSDAKNTINELHNLHKKVIILSGDNTATVNDYAKKLNIDLAYGDKTPKEKTAIIKELQKTNEFVMMVGDGINDAPSLATANIGVSFKTGTDIAANSSDIILMQEDLTKIPKLFNIGKKTVHIIKQNLFWAFFYNILMIPLAIGLVPSIQLNPMIASISMMLSSLTVVFNALRLKKI